VLSCVSAHKEEVGVFKTDVPGDGSYHIRSPESPASGPESRITVRTAAGCNEMRTAVTVSQPDIQLWCRRSGNKEHDHVAVFDDAMGSSPITPPRAEVQKGLTHIVLMVWLFCLFMIPTCTTIRRSQSPCNKVSQHANTYAIPSG
jgi:hypothetical protein